jgi:hypothetical protein
LYRDCQIVFTSTGQVMGTCEYQARKNYDGNHGRPVWSHYYSHDEPVNRRDVTAAVASTNSNVQSGLNEVLEGLAQYFSTHAVRSTAGTHLSQ